MLRLSALFKDSLIRIGYLVILPLEHFLRLLPFFYNCLRKVYHIASSIRLERIKKGLRRAGSIITFFGIKLKREYKFILGVVFAFVFIFTPMTVYSWYKDLPKSEMLAEYGNNRTTKILDRNGKLLYEIYEDRKYDPVALSQIPEHVINSTLAVEDDAFYSHHGFRPLSIVRAAKATLFEDEIQGGSTITQQLVKNVLLTPEQTISRKTKEIVLSYMVEKKYSKDEILELYFNNTPYGGTAWGIQTASQKYFGKNVTDLNLAEATLLAGLPSSPSALSPITNIEGAKNRQKLVLNRMVGLGYITEDEAGEAFNTDLNFVPQEEYINAPHFVWYVKDELVKKFGYRMVTKGGLTVTTTLDLDLQQKAESIVKDQVEKSKNLNISNGAAVVLNAKTGEIMAYVGSKDYFQPGWGAYDVLTAARQAGSSLKPLTYALAFDSGMSTYSTIVDAPITYKNEWETYTPVNYDGRFHGTVTLRQALANSYNIPAVKLVSRIGPDKMVQLGKEMGLSNWEVDGSYGISVTLGGKEVKPLDLANVYASLARGGVYKPVSPFISIKDINGRELYEPDKSEKRVLKEETVYMVTHILSDYYARLPAFGVNNFLSIKGHTTAVKTGTTDLKKDNWTVGYTPTYVVATWVGNNDNTPMNKYLASGLSGAAPMWNRIMTELLLDKEDEKFEAPKTIVVKYDDECKRTELFIKGSKIPDSLCDSDDDDNQDSRDKKEKKNNRRD